MDNQVEFHLRAQDDDDIIKPLADFFAPVAPTKINKPELFFKSVEPLHIVLTIVSATGLASWASKRYLLDPLANRAEEWWEGISLLWKQSQINRSIELTVIFQFPTDTFTVDIGATSNPESLKPVWSNIQQACGLYAKARAEGVQIDQLRFIPDRTKDMLIIAYTENRPRYIADLRTSSLKKIKQSENDDRSIEITGVSILVRQYEYLNVLAESGHEVPAEKLLWLKEEIESKKNRIHE